jgi:hypothetical protein
MDDVFNKVHRRITIINTTLGQSNEVVATVEGLDGEVDESILYGTLGIIANPLPQNGDGAATGLAAVGADQNDPHATIDRRLTRARGPVPKGAISLPGYPGQHVTTEEGAVPGQPKVTIAVSGARITLEGGLAGPTIKIERDGPPAVSVTMGPGGTVDVVRAGIAENVALYAALQAYMTAQHAWIVLAQPTILAYLTVIEPNPMGPLHLAFEAAFTAEGIAYNAASNPALASSAVLRASPT